MKYVIGIAALVMLAGFAAWLVYLMLKLVWILIQLLRPSVIREAWEDRGR